MSILKISVTAKRDTAPIGGSPSMSIDIECDVSYRDPVMAFVNELVRLVVPDPVVVVEEKA